MGHWLVGTRVLLHAGLITPLRPDHVVYAARATRAYGPIAGGCAASARLTPHHVALLDDTGALTYRDLLDHADSIADRWFGRGITCDHTIGLLCRDHRDAVAGMVAAGRLGARLVLMNTGFGPQQMADVIAREGVDLLFLDSEFEAPTASDVALDYSDSGAATVRRPSNLTPLASVHRGVVLLTGGTTGTPKGAGRSVRSPLAAAQFLERIPMRRGDTVFIAAPVFHGTGMSQLSLAMALGCTVVVRSRFDAAATLQAIQQHSVSMLVAVPTMLQRMTALASAGDTEFDTSTLRVVLSAGAALPADLGQRVTDQFGPVLHNFYGCTEVALATVATPPQDWANAPGTVGRPPTSVQVRIYDDADRLIDSPEQTGRIFVRNDLAFECYSGGGTKDSVDGFLSTGDLGHWDDDGRLFIDGRDDDMIVSGGENVFPAEVEATLCQMPGVDDVAVTGVDDEEFGQRLVAYVVASDPEVTGDLVNQHVRTHLALQGSPRHPLRRRDPLHPHGEGRSGRAGSARPGGR